MPDLTDDDFSRYAVADELPANAIGMILEFTDSVKEINSAKVRENHPGMWVAAYKGTLVAVAADEVTLRDMLQQKHIPTPLTAMRLVGV